MGGSRRLDTLEQQDGAFPGSAHWVYLDRIRAASTGVSDGDGPGRAEPFLATPRERASGPTGPRT